jgi:predicted DNA-binding transcriptional regulator AlpA
MSNQSKLPAVEKKLYRVKEIALMCGVGRTSIYEFIKKGLLPRPLKINSMSFWKKEDIDAFFEKLENGGLQE